MAHHQTDSVQKSPNPSGPATESLSGCMGFFFIGILVLFALGFWAWIESPQWFAALVDNRTEVGFRNSMLPEEEKTELVEIVHDLTTAFRNGDLSWSDLPDIVDAVSQSEFAAIAFTVFIEASIISPSGLSEDEKQYAHQQLLRLQWADINKGIPEDSMAEIWSTVTENGKDQRAIRFKKNITDMQLRQFFKKAQNILDANQIPLDPFPFDPSDSLLEAIGKFLPGSDQLQERLESSISDQSR